MRKLLLVLFFSSLIQFPYGQTPDFNSVLSSGFWYKISVPESGFYQLTYDDMITMGFDLSSLDPANIRIYGNGGGMLPMPVDEPRHDDLQENAIIVAGEEDGVFDEEDYVMFYAKGPHTWKYDEGEGLFKHTINCYDDFAYYFITADLGPGKRIEDRQSLVETPTHYVSSFDDFCYHELEEHNLIQSGRTWYGEVFDTTLNYEYLFRFPYIDNEIPVDISVAVAARSELLSSFNIHANDDPLFEIALAPIAPGNFLSFARSDLAEGTYLTDDENLLITIAYNKTHDRSIGWLDYIVLNASRNLVFSDLQMDFRDIASVGQGNVSKFTVSGFTGSEEIFDVSDPCNVVRQLPVESDNREAFEYIIETGQLHEFMTLKTGELLVPELCGSVENQNLHGLSGADMLIVSHPSLEEAAMQLAEFHATHDDMSVVLACTDQIYNEFSSGGQDITAIRDFVRYLWDQGKSRDEQPEFLLLFGDASYDYKDRIEYNTNLVPVYETLESLHQISSFPTDDFLGCLESGEGNWQEGHADESIDISIGRIPAASLDEALGAVDKIIHYSSHPACYHNWRNKLCFVADDEDNNTHMQLAENLAEMILSSNQLLNVEKIYFDFYLQVSTPYGDRYPRANAVLNETVQNGSMIISYNGHGSDSVWANEQVLTMQDILGWTNIDNLPLFLLNTGPFGVFDKPEIISGGEEIVLKSDGGGIGTIASARAGYVMANHAFHISLYEHFLSYGQGENIYIGDLFKHAKNNTPGQNTSSFTLLGDPAVKLPIPDNQVITTHINGIPVEEPMDTIPPGGNILVNGYIASEDGFILQDFNGEISITLYDKMREKYTHNNEGHGAFYFDIQDSVLYEGIFAVNNGLFEATFTLPGDMDLEYGLSKISYYAADHPLDASGYFNELVIGGNIMGYDDPFTKNGELRIYPTVTSDQVYVDFSDVNAYRVSLYIFDINGKMLLDKEIHKDAGINKYPLDVSGLPRGMHLVRMLTEHGEYHGKIVVL